MLVLRSIGESDSTDDQLLNYNENTYNIDIEFWGVGFIELPDIFSITSITIQTSDIPKRFDKYIRFKYHVFSITTVEGNFYIVAAGCRIGKNNWINESRISNPRLMYDEIIHEF
jgi:hypothetical protein